VIAELFNLECINRYLAGNQSRSFPDILVEVFLDSRVRNIVVFPHELESAEFSRAADPGFLQESHSDTQFARSCTLRPYLREIRGLQKIAFRLRDQPRSAHRELRTLERMKEDV
jgi:hypothetical protein